MPFPLLIPIATTIGQYALGKLKGAVLNQATQLIRNQVSDGVTPNGWAIRQQQQQTKFNFEISAKNLKVEYVSPKFSLKFHVGNADAEPSFSNQPSYVPSRHVEHLPAHTHRNPVYSSPAPHHYANYRFVHIPPSYAPSRHAEHLPTEQVDRSAAPRSHISHVHARIGNDGFQAYDARDFGRDVVPANMAGRVIETTPTSATAITRYGNARVDSDGFQVYDPRDFEDVVPVRNEAATTFVPARLSPVATTHSVGFTTSNPTRAAATHLHGHVHGFQPRPASFYGYQPLPASRSIASWASAPAHAYASNVRALSNNFFGMFKQQRRELEKTCDRLSNMVSRSILTTRF